MMGWRGAYLVLVAGLLYLGFNHWGYDDPFITYRYARNIAAGAGFVYNPGERVLSTTSPLFALTLALLYPLWADLPRLAVAIGSLSLAAGALLLWDLSRTWEAPTIGWASLALYPTFPLLVSTLGSETTLYLALSVGAFAGFARRRYPLAAGLAALAVLARPDGALVPALLAAAYLVRERRLPPLKVVALLSLPVLAWAGFAWLYFGSPLPVTLAAKQGQGALVSSTSFLQGFAALLGSYGRHPQYLILAGLAPLSLPMLWRSGRRWLVFVIWPVVYFAAYTALGVSSYFWYYAPLVPGVLVLAGLGLVEIRQTVARRSDQSGKTASPRMGEEPPRSKLSSAQRGGRWGRWSLLGGPANLLTMVLIVGLTFAQVRDLWRLQGQPDRRIAIYRAAGEWLAANISPQQQVGTLEVGMIGYYARTPMVDFAGLIQPEIAARLAQEGSYEASALWSVDRYRPDFLVLHDGLMPRLENGYIRAHCQPTQRFPGEAYGYDFDLVVYACR